MNTQPESSQSVHRSTVRVLAGDVGLAGDLAVPVNARGLVIFAHGSGSSRFSSRNRLVAQVLNDAGLATLLFDLLTSEEESIDMQTRHLRFDIPLLSDRLTRTVDWAVQRPELWRLGVGLFGASTGAAAALGTAAVRPDVQAVVSRGGRPDLAGAALPLVTAPTLLIVGGNDQPVIELNREAAGKIKAPHRMEIVRGATHLFEEPGTLDVVATLARDWFLQYLAPEARKDVKTSA